MMGRASGPVQNTFLAPILDRASAYPDLPFAEIWAAGSRTALTYGALYARARLYGRLFLEAGSAGDVVFIILKHGADLYCSFLGAMLAGMVPSFLPFPNIKQDPQSYWETHRTVFARTRPAAILVYAELEQEVVRACQGLTVRVVTAARLEGLTPLDNLQIQDDTFAALLQHSSGTTGLKKGVALSYGAISLQISSYAKALGLDRSKRELVASWLPLYHDMGLIACFLLPMYLGIEIVSLDAFEWTSRPYLLLEAIEARSATHVWLPNFAFNHIVRATPRGRRYDLSSLRSIINCSEPCKAATFTAFLDRFQDEGVSADKLQVCYAMAETVFAVSNTIPGQPVREITIDRSALYSKGLVREPERGDAGVTLLSNGRPIEGAEVRVLRDGQFVSDGSVGEICVQGRFLFSGISWTRMRQEMQ